MANLVYAHPFQSAIEGQQAGLNAIESAQKARQTNLDYKYNDWYQPLKQAGAQSEVGGALLKQAAAIAHYTGDYSNYNAILAHYLGVPLERLPPGYAQGKGSPAQQRGADMATGLLPPAFAQPNVFHAGDVSAYGQVPGKPTNPELEKAQQDAWIRYYNGFGQPEASGGEVPHTNPLYGIDHNSPGDGAPAIPAPEQPNNVAAPPIPAPEQATGAAPRIAGANDAAAEASKTLSGQNAAATYGVPQPKKNPSIFDGEYNSSDFGG